MNIIWPFLEIVIGSGLIIAIYNNYQEVKIQNRLKLTELNENKFRSILIFMYLVLEPSRLHHTSEIKNPIWSNKKDLTEKQIVAHYNSLIQTNIYNLSLYADDLIIKAIKDFLLVPSEEKYFAVVSLMKKNLWGC